MRYLITLLALIASLAFSTVMASAKGGRFSLYGAWDQPSHPVVPAGIMMPPSLSLPSLSLSHLLSMCGRGRYRGPKTHQCQGPADIK